MGTARRQDVDPDDACGLKVAVQATTYEDTDELPGKVQACVDAGKPAIEILPFDTQDAATNAVVLGQADAMSADSPVTLYAIAQTDGKLEPAGETFDVGPVRHRRGEGLRTHRGAAGGLAVAGRRRQLRRRSSTSGASQTAAIDKITINAASNG